MEKIIPIFVTPRTQTTKSKTTYKEFKNTPRVCQ